MRHATAIARIQRWAAGLVADRRRRAILVLGAGAAVAAWLFAFDPAAAGSPYPACPFLLATGLDCPGCGSARALHQLLHGHPVTAFTFNPLLVLYLPILGYVGASQLFVVLRGRPLPTPFLRAVWIRLLLALLTAYWVFRNTPAYPFAG